MSHTNLKPFLTMGRFQESHGGTYLEDSLWSNLFHHAVSRKKKGFIGIS